MGADTGYRHLRWELFEARIGKGPPSLEHVQGTPRIDLFIEPQGRRIGARFYADELFRITSPLAEVSIRPIGVGTDTALELSTGNESLFRDFYALCCQIADRVQIAKQPISLALRETLDSWAELVRPRKLLSHGEQIGLIGELLFLLRAGKRLGWERVAGGWYGPDSEEHDFVLPSVDVEVKTTTNENRIHEISSLTQLLPKSGRQLFLVSVQLSPAAGARDAISLPILVANVLNAATAASDVSADFIRNRLKTLHWSDNDAEYYQERFCLRNPLEACYVGKKFPAIVPATIKALGADRVSRIEKVSYRIKVDGLGAREGTPRFDRLFQGGAKR